MIGKKRNENVTNETENKVIAEFENNISYRNPRYETTLLWKMEPENLESHFKISKKV